MHVFFDHLTAILIGAVVLLTLSVTQMRSSHAGIEQVASHGVRAKTLVFGYWIERDILDLGRNMGRNRFAFGEPADTTTGDTRLWEFSSDSTCTSVSGCSIGGVSIARDARARMWTRYRLVPTQTARVRDSTGTRVERQLYLVRRDTAVTAVTTGASAPAAGAWRPSHLSLSTLSSFQVETIGRNGRDVPADEADFIRVRFTVVPEYILDPDNYIREMYWVSTLKVRPYWEPPPEL